MYSKSTGEKKYLPKKKKKKRTLTKFFVKQTTIAGKKKIQNINFLEENVINLNI